MDFREAPTMTLPLDALSPLDAGTEPAVPFPPAPHLVLGEAIGAGGMGQVRAGQDRALRRPFAAKLLHPALRADPATVRRFLEEAELTAALEHPNIVPVHSLAARPETGPFFTMKRVDGRTLHQFLVDNQGQPWDDVLDEIIDTLIKVCDALELAHSKGIAHCDLKAGNILLGDYGAVYLTDWGVARRVPWEAPRQPGGRRAISGTVTMMAPEQARGEVGDTRVDVFGMGALLYFILARRAPYSDPDLQAAWRRALAGDRLPLSRAAPRAPATLRAIADKAMAHAPEDRYPDIGALRADLDRFRRGRLGLVPRAVPLGAWLIREGEESDALYFIRAGRFQVTRSRPDGTEVVVREVGPGEVVGEVGLLAGGRRSASVRALTDAEVLPVAAAQVEEALGRIPPWLRTVIETTGARFHEREQTRPEGPPPPR